MFVIFSSLCWSIFSDQFQVGAKLLKGSGVELINSWTASTTWLLTIVVSIQPCKVICVLKEPDVTCKTLWLVKEVDVPPWTGHIDTLAR